MFIVFGRKYWQPFATAILFTTSVAVQSASANDECDIRRIAASVKTVSILRQVENALNVLALAQTDAIISTATGVDTLALYGNDSGFFGPLGGLQKTTDKNEAELNNLDKSIRRLMTFETVGPRYEDLRENALEIIDTGYDVLRKLEAGDVTNAVDIYTNTTVVALNKARADAYTAMSNLERPISLAAYRCKKT